MIGAIPVAWLQLKHEKLRLLIALSGVAFAVILILVYPVMGLVMGWISGLLTSAIYNFIVRWTGGLLLEFDRGAVSPSDAAV